MRNFIPAPPMNSDAFTELDENEIAEHVASILAIPDDQLPDADARQALVTMARLGYEVYAYRPVHQPEYVIWIRQEDLGEEARWQPDEWAAAWRAWAAENKAENANEGATTLPFTQPTNHAFLTVTTSCLYCLGTGRRRAWFRVWLRKQPCHYCSGTGRRTTIRPITIGEDSITIEPPISTKVSTKVSKGTGTDKEGA